MIYIRPEGAAIRNGINFYPWRERKYSIGFILRCGNNLLQVRYNSKIPKFYFVIRKFY